jgi:hypothetical protein
VGSVTLDRPTIGLQANRFFRHLSFNTLNNSLIHKFVHLKNSEMFDQNSVEAISTIFIFKILCKLFQLF